jgi:hypothetical protein
MKQQKKLHEIESDKLKIYDQTGKSFEPIHNQGRIVHSDHAT